MHGRLTCVVPNVPWLVRRQPSDVKNGDIDLRANELTQRTMRNLVAEGQYKNRAERQNI